MEESQREQTSIGDHVECQKYSRITFALLDHVTRRRFVAIVMTTGLVAALAAIIDAIQSPTAINQYFEVSGFSMAPTLMGRSEIMRCPHCLYEGRFPIDRDDTECQCPQCGDELNATDELLNADQVKANLDSQRIARGDLVAIAGPHPNQVTQNFVKRVIGMPGDQVALRGSQLTINGVLIHELPWAHDQDKPTVAVYRETGRGRSRWKRSDDWLVYHHVNPYRGSIPSPVLDDYAVNVTLSRQLESVSELMVRLRPETTSFSNSEIAIWKPDAEETFKAPVSELTPVAIQITDDEYDLSDVEIRRCIVYRLRPGDDRSGYPMKLGEDVYFVLGDNVPISIDSRDWGPVRHEKILCRVTLVKPERR